MTGTQITLEEAFGEAIAHHQAGRLPEAEQFYRAILRAVPNHPDANHNLGVIAIQGGQAAASLPHFKAALDLNPDHAQYRMSCIEALIQAGRPNEARRILEEGRRRGLQVPAVDALAARLKNAGSLDVASTMLRALEHHQAGRFQEAEALYRQVLDAEPANPYALNAIGMIAYAGGHLEEAERLVRQAVAANGNVAVFQQNLCAILTAMHRSAEAESCCRQVLEKFGDHAETFNNLGSALLQQERYAEAIPPYRRAVELNPGFADAHSNLGGVLCRTGEMKAGIVSLQTALKLHPHLSRTFENLIFYLDLLPGFSVESLQAERKRWATHQADPLFVERQFNNIADPERILRIGYVSADFRDHSAANGFLSLFTKFDRGQFETYAYSNSPIIDKMTEVLRNGVTAWREIHHLTDDDAAELITKDGIDILVDLSGHTAGNRLLMFARKPAPIQVSMMGYPTGTGMKAMDALLVDEIVVPPEEKHLYAEEIRYLPCVIGYSADKLYPEINDLPALSADGVTFGSFNRMAKVSDDTLLLWASLISALPESRLILKAWELDDESVRARVLRHFAGMEDRVTLLGKTSWLEHVRAYNKVDIALDPFPHGGGVTTIESIRMGVPVLTLKYCTFAGRVSASILTTLGLTDWIAESPDEYVKIAIEKSKDLALLAKLRAKLRGVFAASILGDPDYYLRAAEKEYRVLWRQWCRTQQVS